MNKFDAYLKKCLESVNAIYEANDSAIPNPDDFNANTTSDVADKLFEELQEHFGEEIKKIEIPSTISKDINAFLWTNDTLKLSYQITVTRSRVDNDYKITIRNLNKAGDVIDIADDQLESQINDVIEKMQDIKSEAKGPTPTSEENPSMLPNANNAGLAQEPQTAPPIAGQPVQAGEATGSFTQGLQG